MEKNIEKNIAKKHTFYASEQSVTMSGVENVISFDEKEMTVKLSTGAAAIITGENFNVEKLDVEQGLLEISGRLLSLKYGNAKEKQGFLKRILK